jgi:hypothetical protein
LVVVTVRVEEAPAAIKTGAAVRLTVGTDVPPVVVVNPLVAPHPAAHKDKTMAPQTAGSKAKQLGES